MGDGSPNGWQLNQFKVSKAQSGLYKPDFILLNTKDGCPPCCEVFVGVLLLPMTSIRWFMVHIMRVIEINAESYILILNTISANII